MGSSDSRGGSSPPEPPLGTAEADGAALDGDGEADAGGDALGEDGGIDGVGPHATTISAMAATRPIHERRMTGC
jgi:hypothetical protein